MSEDARVGFPGDFIKMMRPLQWIKNGFVFMGFLFGTHYLDLFLFQQVLITAIAFCCVSSSIYILNDLLDYEQDKHHPKKKSRPIPAGRISAQTALIASICLAMVSFVLGYFVSTSVQLILLTYYLLNLLYSYSWKHVVIVDVFCIAAGFMLRILAGTVGVGIPPSKWLLLCSLFLTLFLALAKRRAEVISLSDAKLEHRQVLEHYGSQFLDVVLAICGAGVVLSYSLYTMSPYTVSIHKTENLIYTVPFVLYGIFRYLYILYHQNQGGDPTMDLVKDRHIIGVVVLWASMTVFIIN